MTEPQQQKTLVALIRETGWWPPDLQSRYRDPQTGEFSNTGQHVALESIDLTDDLPPVRWKVRSEETDSSSLPIPFKRYDMICGLTDLPTFCTVVVAADKDSINPVADCCALVPFGLNDLARLTPKGRIELGEQAIVAVLKIIDQWPPLDLKRYVRKLHPWSIWLERGETVTYDPVEWIIDGKGVFRDEMVRYYLMTNKRAKSLVTVGIAVAKQKRPESIDPYQDCWALNELGFTKRLKLRLHGFKSPSSKLCRAAIAVYLDSLGAWPPGRDIKTQKPVRLVIRELLQDAIAAIERFNPPHQSIASLTLLALETILEKREEKPMDQNTAVAVELFGGLKASLEKAESFEELEQVCARYRVEIEPTPRSDDGKT